MSDPAHISQDERYRQARAIYNRKLDYWREEEKPDLFSAFKIFQELANEKYGKSYYPLSRLYETNRDNEESQDRARHFAQLAFNWCYANRDNQDAELWGDLGNMYLHGDGVEENVEEAVLWHRKAAEHGYAESQFELGHMYAFGIGVPVDGKEVEKWWRLAAEQGHAMALINLAMTYELGQDGVTQNYKEAAKWYRVAADQGEYSAQSALCKMYVAGRGVPQDYEGAEKLFKQLLDQGYELTADLVLVQEILRMQKELAALKNVT
jgi:TPR repeat protein